jgi:tetratricopeptide (TPR) repeat protein
MHVGTRRVLFALCALLIPHFAAAQDGDVALDVRNGTSNDMTVFALWDNGTRVRLGELSANQARNFSIPVRGDDVTLMVQVAEVRGRGNRTGGDDPEDFVSVRPGDGFEWEIRNADPLDLFYRRVTSGSADIESSEPEVDRYTAISQVRINEAQGIEDDSLRVAAWRDLLVNVNEGLASSTDNPMAYLHLGIVHYNLKDYVAADLAFDQAEAMYPAYVDEEFGTGVYRLGAWVDAYNDATLRLEAQDSEGAVDLYNMANMIYAHRAEAYLNLGVTYAGLGDIEGSIQAWRSALAVIDSPEGEPGDSTTRAAWDTEFWLLAQSNLGRLLPAVGRSEEAVPVFEAILERFPDDTDAQSSLAMALIQSGQGGDALGIFDAILASEDGAPLDYYNAGVSLYSADQMDQAVLGFEKTVARSPMYRDALQNLVQTLNELEDFEAQVPHSERLIELDPFNDFVYLMHVRALVQVGREPEGVDALALMQALPFVVDALQLQPLAAGCRITGIAVNKALDPGTSITLRFTFYDNDGNPIGSADTEVTISDPEVAHDFEVTFDEGEMSVLGYSYELVG